MESKPMMSKIERSQLIAAFEKAAAAQVDWNLFMSDVLGLPMKLLSSVQLALSQGRWRQAQNPRAYIKVVAKRESRKSSRNDWPSKETLRIPAIFDDNGCQLSHDAYIDYLSYPGPVKEGGVWHARPDWDDDPRFCDEQGRAIPCIGGRPVPSAVLTTDDDDPDGPLRIDWPKLSALANLDEGEDEILGLRLMGLTRQEVLSELADDEQHRLHLQAAWRRLDRDLGKLKAILTR
jgi:hypothetical protein